MSDEEQAPGVADSYEAKYMGGAEALARSTMRMPWWFFALMGVASVVTLGSAVAAWTPVPLLSFAMLGVVTLLFSHLRMTVTASHLHVQLGLFGPKIALASIENVVAEDYKALKYGGWGIRRSLDGTWAFSVPGGRGRCVRITYTADNGKRRTIVVSSDEAEAVASAIEKARAALRPERTGVRVNETDAEKPAEDAVEVKSNEATKTAKG